MFTITLHDERNYQWLMQKAAEHGGSIDEAIAELSGTAPDNDADETPGERLMRFIDDTKATFRSSLKGEDTRAALDTEFSRRHA